MSHMFYVFVLFFFNDTATTEIYTLSLHDALPIYWRMDGWIRGVREGVPGADAIHGDRKSTRLNSSHGYISYAVFCLKQKNNRRRLSGISAPPRLRYKEAHQRLHS